MLRAANLKAEIFIDQYDDGAVRADAILLMPANRRVFAQGSATFESSDWGAAPIDDELIAAWALFDLARKLINGPSSPHPTGRRSFAGTITITSDGAMPAITQPIDEGGDSAPLHEPDPSPLPRGVVMSTSENEQNICRYNPAIADRRTDIDRTRNAAKRSSASERLEPSGSRRDELSERELEVLRYLPSMLTNSEIAAELYVSVNTIKAHTRSIYAKLGASRRQDAVVLAYEHGLL
jgi:DNA-binding CsgD family transcriptional regulator